MTLVLISIAIAFLIVIVVVGTKYNNEQKINKAVDKIHPFFNYEWSQGHFINSIEHLKNRNSFWNRHEQVIETGNNAGKKIVVHTKKIDNLVFKTLILDGFIRDGIIVCNEEEFPLKATMKFNFADGTSYTTIENKSLIFYEDIDLFMNSEVVSYELNGDVIEYSKGAELIQVLKLTNF
jgi:hypothetical protein